MSSGKKRRNSRWEKEERGSNTPPQQFTPDSIEPTSEPCEPSESPPAPRATETSGSLVPYSRVTQTKRLPRQTVPATPPPPIQFTPLTNPIMHQPNYVLVESSLIGNTERLAPRFTRMGHNNQHPRLLLPPVELMSELVRNTAQYLAHSDEKSREPIRSRLPVPEYLLGQGHVLKISSNNSTHLYRLLCVTDELQLVATEHRCAHVLPYSIISSAEPALVRMHAPNEHGAWEEDHEAQIRLYNLLIKVFEGPALTNMITKHERNGNPMIGNRGSTLWLLMVLYAINADKLAHDNEAYGTQFRTPLSNGHALTGDEQLEVCCDRYDRLWRLFRVARYFEPTEITTALQLDHKSTLKALVTARDSPIQDAQLKIYLLQFIQATSEVNLNGRVFFSRYSHLTGGVSIGETISF